MIQLSMKLLIFSVKWNFKTPHRRKIYFRTRSDARTFLQQVDYIAQATTAIWLLFENLCFNKLTKFRKYADQTSGWLYNLIYIQFICWETNQQRIAKMKH